MQQQNQKYLDKKFWTEGDDEPQNVLGFKPKHKNNKMIMILMGFDKVETNLVCYYVVCTTVMSFQH